MSDPAAITLDDVKRRDARRLRIGCGCLAALVLFCCIPCGGSVAIVARRASAIGDYQPPPFVDPATETDPLWKRIALAQQAAMSQSCDDVGASFVQSLDAEPAETQTEVVLALRGRLAALDTEAMNAACSAVYANGCDEHRFLAFRAEVVRLGRPVYERALRDPDALVRYLPPAARCDILANLSGIDTSATRDPTPRTTSSRLVPNLCRRFVCSPSDILR